MQCLNIIKVFLTHVMVSYGCVWLPLSHSDISASSTFLTLISSKFQESSPFSWQVGGKERELNVGWCHRQGFHAVCYNSDSMNAPSYSYLSRPHVSEDADSTPEKINHVAQPSPFLLRDGHMPSASSIQLGFQTFVEWLGSIFFRDVDKQGNHLEMRREVWRCLRDRSQQLKVNPEITQRIQILVIVLVAWWSISWSHI